MPGNESTRKLRAIHWSQVLMYTDKSERVFKLIIKILFSLFNMYVNIILLVNLKFESV